MLRGLRRYKAYTKWLPTGTVVTLTGCGMVADWYVSSLPKREKREFIAQGVQEALQDQLQTGDILLFNRTVVEYNPFKMLYVMMSKYITGSSWDHAAVVVRDREEDLPYILECTYEGMKLTAYDERMLYCRDEEVIWRPLEGERSEESLRLIDEMVVALTGNEDWGKENSEFAAMRQAKLQARSHGRPPAPRQQTQTQTTSQTAGASAGSTERPLTLERTAAPHGQDTLVSEQEKQIFLEQVNAVSSNLLGVERIFRMFWSIADPSAPRKHSRVNVLGNLLSLQDQVVSNERKILEVAEQEKDGGDSQRSIRLTRLMRQLRGLRILSKDGMEKFNEVQEAWDSKQARLSSLDYPIPSVFIVVSVLQLLEALPRDASSVSSASRVQATVIPESASNPPHKLVSLLSSSTAGLNVVPKELIPTRAEYAVTHFLSDATLPLNPANSFRPEAFVLTSAQPLKYLVVE